MSPASSHLSGGICVTSQVFPFRLVLLAFAMLSSASALAAQGPPRTPPRDTLTDSIRAIMRKASRDAADEARRRRASDTASIRARAEAAAPTAFADPNARMILERARVARMQQDSALRAYRAKATQRVTAKLGVRRVGLEKLVFSGDNVAMISWQRGVGVWVRPIGSRMVIPMANEVDGDFSEAISIPYFPGRDQLWVPSSDMGMVRADINEQEMIHPIARGAEAYYRYETGDSVDIKLGDGKVIAIRELRVTARKPQWRLFVGSFWFDRESGQLVRAAYRLAVDIDIWDLVSEENQHDVERDLALAVIRDSLMRERVPRDVYVRDSTRRANTRSAPDDDEPPAWVKGMFRPAKAKLDGITVEYGLYQGRFWLPRANTASASAQVGFMRMPIEINEKFEYELVNGDMSLPPIPPPRSANTPGRTDTVIISSNPDNDVSITIGGRRPDSAAMADARFRRDSLRIVARTGRSCHRDSTYTRTENRYDGQLRIAYDVPCDRSKLLNSPELPKADTDTDEIFDMRAAEDLLKLLDLDLQPAWAPQRPTIRSGLDFVRYNRIEGLSVGAQVEQKLGAGYTLSAVGRIGHDDLHANGEFTVLRSNGRRDVRATVYHRLSATNPEWAGALSWGPSLPAFVYGRDEGFYFRNFGAELVDVRESSGITTRLFIERQWTAGDADVVNTFSLGSAVGNRRFLPNIIAEEVSMTGLSVEWLRTLTPGFGTSLFSAMRAEAGIGTFEYGRGSLELTATRPIGRFSFSLMGSGGSSLGRMPVQRQWYVGGLRTVRGQIAGTQEGNAFWLARAELGTRSGIIRPVTFFDIGWAGSRDAIGRTQPQRGAGIGVSLLDGIFRMDFSRGLYPNKRWRTDVYLQGQL
jgi:hypothetical protein